MSEQGTQQEPEDLSKLNGPSKWYTVWLVFSLMVLISSIVFRLSYGPINPNTMNGWWAIGWLLTTLGATISTLLSSTAWIGRNNFGYPIRWYKDGDIFRVTARGYPEQAKGLVIEVQVKASPSFRFMWGTKGWHKDPAGDNYWVSNSGEKLWAGGGSELAREAEGLTKDVVEMFAIAYRWWRIIPLDAGRVLRFVDTLGCGIEMYFMQFDGVDLEEILKSASCADYHKRMQEKARNHDTAMTLTGEFMRKSGSSVAPIIERLPLGSRVAELELVATRLRDARDSAWAELRLVLNSLLSDMERVGRPNLKLAAARRVEPVMKFLHEHIPADHPLRAGDGISQEALDKIARVIAEAEAKLALVPRGKGVGTEA